MGVLTPGLVQVVDLWRAAEDGTEGPAHGYNNSCDGRFPTNMGDRQKYDQGTSEDYSDWPQDFYSFVTGTSVASFCNILRHTEQTGTTM